MRIGGRLGWVEQVEKGDDKREGRGLWRGREREGEEGREGKEGDERGKEDGWRARMGWDEMGMRWDRRLRRALLHCTALTPFFLSLARPTD